jgi:hypothetical protein
VSIALVFPGLLAAQGNAGTLFATATVVAHPARIQSLGRPQGAAGLEATAGSWRLSGRPGAPVGLSFTLPDTLTPARAEGGPPLALAPRRATARWQRPGHAAVRFDAEAGATALIGGADDPTVRLALAWAPRAAEPVPPGWYLGTLVMTLAYY